MERAERTERAEGTERTEWAEREEAKITAKVSKLKGTNGSRKEQRKESAQCLISRW